MLKLIVIVLILFLNYNSLAADDNLDPHFGHGFFNPDYENSALSIGSIYRLSERERAVLNIENSADLLQNDLWFYHPDFVTAGREVYLSPVSMGNRFTRIFWRGRPFRNPLTFTSDLRLLPVNSIGGVSSTVWGGINGIVSAGGMVDLKTFEYFSDSPISSLHHRVGFYDFAPVEFIHTRKLAEDTRLTWGGQIPSSWGRFPHARYHGHTLFSELDRAISDSEHITFSYQSGKHNKEIAYSDTNFSTKRNDLDVVFNRLNKDDSEIQIGLYRGEQTESYSQIDYSGKELGLYSILQDQNKGSHFRISHLNGYYPDGRVFRTYDFEGTYGLKLTSGKLSSSIIAGLNGRFDNPQPLGLFEIRYNLRSSDNLFAQLKSVRVQESPFERYDKLVNRPWNNIEPVFNAASELLVTGSELTNSGWQGLNLGFQRDIQAYYCEFSAFYLDAFNPRVWMAANVVNSLGTYSLRDNILFPNSEYSIKPDSALKMLDIDKWTISGLFGKFGFRKDPYRYHFTILNSRHKRIHNNSTPITYREPSLRIISEAGWHNIYFNGNFEVDILFSGKYYGAYFAYARQDSIQGGEFTWENIGAAYPLDFRFTSRIRRFTFYYGVHNWNSFQYELVPGYKMIHREEYWGIDWTLLN